MSRTSDTPWAKGTIALLNDDGCAAVDQVKHICNLVAKTRKDVESFKSMSSNPCMAKDMVDRFEAALANLAGVIADRNQTASVLTTISAKYLTRRNPQPQAAPKAQAMGVAVESKKVCFAC